MDTLEKWAPLKGMPDGAEGCGIAGCKDIAERWGEQRRALKANGPGDRFLEGWLTDQGMLHRCRVSTGY